MSFDKIQKLVSSLAKSVEDNERVATPILSAKINKYLETYPHDQTLGAMSRVIGKMAANNTTFIRKADLRELYNKLYSRNTKFAEFFGEELGTTEKAPEVTPVREEAVNVQPYQVDDQILANALNNLFDSSIPLKTYSQPLADKALKSVASTLDAWNLRPNSLAVSAGNEKFLVIQADYDTPKGVTSLLVPIEIVNNKPAEANAFIGNAGPTDLNNTNIKSYVKAFAGKKLAITAGAILGAITKAASENRVVSDAEIAATRLNAKRQGQSEFFQNQIVGQKISEASVKDVELPKYDEFVSFEKNFASPYGVASFSFGEDKVKIARDVIARSLTSFGYKNPQITVTGSDDKTIYYGVALDAGQTAFTVPIKMANGKVSSPTVMICNGSLSSFTKDSITKLYINNETDYKVAAAASPQFGLKSSDLINNIRVALASSNYAKAEDALNVLSTMGDEKAYAAGFSVYMNGLSEHKTEAETCCSMQIKSASSKHPVCGHTGLPLHKVYQDKQGNCRPLYRRDMEDTYEGAVFNNSKIFG
jgi:hypothetical protein